MGNARSVPDWVSERVDEETVRHLAGNRFDPEQAAEAHGGLARHTMRQRSASAVDLQKKGS